MRTVSPTAASQPPLRPFLLKKMTIRTIIEVARIPLFEEFIVTLPPIYSLGYRKTEIAMKMKVIALLVAGVLSLSTTFAQELPRKVQNVELLDLDGKPAKLPYFGEKNLMIFYVDPDRHKQNEDFTFELEENHRAQGDNIYGFGVMNLKDAPMIPNGMARSMAKKRTEKNGATVLADQERTLSSAWNLGDCNNQFVLMIVSKEGELVFLRKGVLSEADKEAFYNTIDKYR